MNVTAGSFLVIGGLHLLIGVAVSAQQLLLPTTRSTSDAIVDGLTSRDPARTEAAVNSIRRLLASNPIETVDRLNKGWLLALIEANRCEAAIELSSASVLALPADTWRVEQLQRHRVRALLEMGRTKEALAAAKGLYNVAGIGFTPEALVIMAEALKAAHPREPGIVSRFKLQQLVGAQTDEAQRRKQLAELGEPVLAGIEIDAALWEEAIRKRAGKDEYRELYGTGNLLLLAGRTEEALKAFEKVVEIAPAGEARYASEGLAKAMKARDGMIGPANGWILSVGRKD